ncbi:HAD family phosphatase [Candidatus Dependentiae bacterium]|nr:HAD family phosphatase [Candidatus Dependentiae bacterium]MBU4387408.1 HAD family phosphatase [Candidatus Dependentiae bacterium]MCG2756773.1 HAD family phosphatase [Candidatus Dependentiae bacterium]
MKKIFLLSLFIIGTIFCIEQKDKGNAMERHVKYKNIIFDFGGVLTEFPLQKIFQDIFVQGEEVMSMELWQELFWCDSFAELQRGNITAAQALKTLPKKYNQDQVIKFFYSLPAYLTPVPQVINLVKLLKEKGYKLFLLSNSASDIDFDKTEYGFLKLFDGLIYSHIVHAIKPDPEIYHILFDTYKIKAEECLFIDDFEKNIIGAKAVGMDGIICVDHDLMIKELGKFGVLQQAEIDSLYLTIKPFEHKFDQKEHNL